MKYELIALGDEVQSPMTAPIDVAQVVSVYSGKNGACCCGCSGKYSYTSAHREIGTKRRGYAVDDEDVNDRSVKIIVSKMNKQLADVKMENDISGRPMAVLEAGGRLYFACLL